MWTLTNFSNTEFTSTSPTKVSIIFIFPLYFHLFFIIINLPIRIFFETISLQRLLLVREKLLGKCFEFKYFCFLFICDRRLFFSFIILGNTLSANFFTVLFQTTSFTKIYVYIRNLFHLFLRSQIFNLVRLGVCSDRVSRI